MLPWHTMPLLCSVSRIPHAVEHKVEQRPDVQTPTVNNVQVLKHGCGVVGQCIGHIGSHGPNAHDQPCCGRVYG